MERLVRLHQGIPMHLELARQDFRTTFMVSSADAEINPSDRVPPAGSGLMVDIGAGSDLLIAMRRAVHGSPLCATRASMMYAKRFTAQQDVPATGSLE
jgi:hypothetical protein